MNDLQIREFEQNIINYINRSPLPMTVKELVLFKVYSQTKEEADKTVLSALHQKKEEEEKKDNE